MPERTEEPISGAAGERVKAGSPESSDCDSTDGSAKDPSLIPKHTDLGKRVLFFSTHDKKEKYGVLRFLGETEFAEGVWCGIELDKEDGKNNGSIHGIRYFTCKPNYGVFVPLPIVELDPSRRSRSRPNSAPSSRTPSADRGTKKAKTMAPAASGGGGSGKPHFILQQELVTRLSTPALQKRKQASSPASSRGPMRAFATKGVDQPLTQHNRKKAAFTPFKSGEIKKAVSTDNLKTLKDKEKKSQSGGLTGKKSSSQKDLRSASASSVAGKGMSSSPQGSGRRKPQRANSYSDLFDENSSPAYGGGGGGGGAKTKSKTTSDAKLKRNSDVISMSNTQVYDWPRTSTPGNRNDQTPDGCSSPEGAEMSDTHSTTSSTADTMSSGYEKMDTDSPATQERGFIATPDSSHTSSVNGNMSLDSPPTGLVTPASQFVRNERKSPSIDACRVASPDGSSTHLKQVYKNRPSGTATLPHPLTLQTAGSLANGCEDSYLLTPTSFMEHFLGPSTSVEGVSVPQLLEALREHCKQWHSAQVQSEIRIKTLEQELAETKSRFLEAEKSHRAELAQVTKKASSQKDDLQHRAHKFEDQVRTVKHSAV